MLNRLFYLLCLGAIGLAACQGDVPPLTPTAPSRTEGTATPTELPPTALRQHPTPGPTQTPLLDSTGCTQPVTVSPLNGQITFQNVTFTLDPALADSLIAQYCTALPFSAGQAPGAAHPAYASFVFPKLTGTAADFGSELRVYAVAGDMSPYAFPLNSLDNLRSNVTQSPQPATWFDAAPLHARQAYLHFNGGAGVRGVVQYLPSPFFFTNNGILYEFDGLTDDRQSAVVLRHSLAVPFLMDLTGPDPRTNVNPGAIPIPAWPADPAQQRQIIDAYNAEALRRLDVMTDYQVTPSLAALDALLESLKITGP
jgi:hypothetical protein